MSLLKTIIRVVLSGLGLSSGLAKIRLNPAEVTFFTAMGLNTIAVILLGIIQVINFLFIFFKKWRNLGLIVLGATFAFSTILIFLSGDNIFGLISIVPLMIIFVIFKIDKK